MLILLAASTPGQAQDREIDLKGKIGVPQKSLVLDGSCVLTAGNLQMNVTNFGFLGSLPKSTYPMAESPSAEWPAGSGVEYLYAAGIWVGALMDGLPSVSTGYPETEFYPPSDPIDHIYRAYEGMKGGGTYPGVADDDGDGLVNEDWLNGRDDDGDGLIDEDFAAIGRLMYSCWFTDDNPIAQQAWPAHVPMGLVVRQETYQWSEEALNNFVGVHYSITTRGSKMLSNVYVGIYADLDAGPRQRPNYWRDDEIGTFHGIWCAPITDGEYPVRLSVVYVYDNDGDDGATPGYFGVAVLGARMEIAGSRDAIDAGLRSVHIFAGLLPYENGGDPVDDSERYGALSSGTIDPNTTIPNDYRALLGIGPFPFLTQGATITVDLAYVAGKGLQDMLNNAATAVRVYNGIWYDMDKNPSTGINGRETPLFGPIDGIDPDPCDNVAEKIKVAKGDTIWVNADCQEEMTLYNYPGCYKGKLAFRDFQTGTNGNETQLRWVTSTAPPPPSLRAVPGDHKVTLFWDNLSELVPDMVTLQYDFEGYQVWRADDWHRPLGTTVKSGPSSDLWHLIDSRDLIDGVPPDVDLKKPYELGGYKYEPLGHLKNRETLLKAFEEGVYYYPFDKVPCPPGVAAADCDTLEALARWNLGFDGGRQYYTYIDKDAKNGLPYFYAVVAYDRTMAGTQSKVDRVDTPYSNFVYAMPVSRAQEAGSFKSDQVYVVPNPVTKQAMAPWRFGPNNADPSGAKLEFRNLPKCRSTVRVFTIAGDLVQTLSHDGTLGDGTLAWNLISRNGQDITSGVYIFSVDPQDKRFPRVIGKFVVIR